MSGPLVSIVIPTRDRAAWLPRAIDSVLAQDYPRVEVVVIDDASQDDTPRLLADYLRRSGGRLRTERQPSSGGMGPAINRGWDIAAGEIVGYLSDDDALHPSAIGRLIAALDSDPRAAVAYPAYQVIDELGTVLDTVLPIEYSTAAALRLQSTEIGPGALIRRAALRRAGGWESSFRWLADLLLWMKLGLVGTAIRVPEVLAYWTRHGESTTVQLGVDHGLEFIRAVHVALSLPGLPAPTPAARAEALRNACVQGAMFSGPGGDWPAERFGVIDLHRLNVSGWTANRNPTAFPGAGAAETRQLCRRLADNLERSPAPGHSVASGTSPGQGFAAAVARLQAAGVWLAERTSVGDIRQLRIAMLEAAVACEPDLDRAERRFLIFDRERLPGLDPGTSLLMRNMLFGVGGSPTDLRRLIETKEAAAAQPSS
jgi:hypothetical protein